MQIQHHLHSGSVASGYAESRVSSLTGVAELTNNLQAETAGNARFPAIDKSEQTEESKPQDRRDTRSGRATANNDNEETADQRENSAKETQEKQALEQERREIAELAARDREVRAHEQAHVAVGGRYAGAASYRYERGPDGVNYAISGEVPISTSKENTPEATLLKAQIVRRAALAPAEPSPQDRSVAAKASSMEAEARKEIALENQRDQTEKTEAKKEGDETVASADKPTNNSDPFDANARADGISENSRVTNPVPVPILPGSVGGRLFQSISNSTLNSRQPGSLLDQIA